MADAKSPRPSVSVVIPTKNAGSGFAETLQAIRNQTIESELVVIDSGSTDETLVLARQYGAKVESIPPESFNHGGTRNRGIAQSRGRYCVLLVQDALPVGKTWLQALLLPLDDPNVAGVAALVEPRPDADPVGRWEALAQSDLLGPFNRLSEVRDWKAFDSLSREDRLRLVTCNNVASALRREVWEEMPFSETAFAEDLDWGLRALRAGHRLAYAPDAVVRHSHDRPPLSHLTRLYLSGKMVPELLGYAPRNPEITGDEHFFRLVGSLIGEVALLFEELSRDTTQLPSARFRLRLSVEAEGRRKSPREFRNYQQHPVRDMLYRVLDEVSSCVSASPLEELRDTVAKVLARTLGSFSALYYLDCQRRGELSNRMRDLDHRWTAGSAESALSLSGGTGPHGRTSRAHPQLAELAACFPSDIGGAGIAFSLGVPGTPHSQTPITEPLRRAAAHLLNAGLLSVRSWLRRPIHTAGMALPLGWKLRIHRALDRPLFDLSAYARFQPDACADAAPRIEVATAAGPGGDNLRALRVVTPNPCTDSPGLLKDLLETSASERWEVTTVIDRPPAGLVSVGEGTEPNDAPESSFAAQDSIQRILFKTSDSITPRQRFFEACAAHLAERRPDLCLHHDVLRKNVAGKDAGIAGAVFIAPGPEDRARALQIVLRGLPVVYWHETPFSSAWRAEPGRDVVVQRARIVALILDKLFPRRVAVAR